jgi:hypothetical protein
MLQQTRYISELLATTRIGYLGISDYVERQALLVAHKDSPHRTHKAIVAENFDQLAADVAERFHSTVGQHKALVALVEALPRSDSQPAEDIKGMVKRLLRRSRADYEFLDDQARLHQEGEAVDVICKRCVAWFAKRFDLNTRIMHAIDDLRGGDTTIHLLRRAVRPVLASAIADYAMLLDQYRAWLAEIAHAKRHGIPNLSAILWNEKTDLSERLLLAAE